MRSINSKCWFHRDKNLLAVPERVLSHSANSGVLRVVTCGTGGDSESSDAVLPGGNTANGQGALSSLTTGTFNSAFGFFSLLVNTDASFSTGLGAGATAGQ